MVTNKNPKQMSDRELKKELINNSREIEGGCYPLQDAIKRQCILYIEWADRKSNAGRLPESIHSLRRVAQEVVTLFMRAKLALIQQEPEKAVHLSVTASNLFSQTSFGMHLEKVERRIAAINRYNQNKSSEASERWARAFVEIEFLERTSPGLSQNNRIERAAKIFGFDYGKLRSAYFRWKKEK